MIVLQQLNGTLPIETVLRLFTIETVHHRTAACIGVVPQVELLLLAAPQGYL